jgi:putative DNA methylase
MSDQDRRLIEVAFPLAQTSLDSVHEKNIRHGNISTLHIWPARRPLAASRAALLATLLPDPLSDAERQQLVRDIGGDLIHNHEKNRAETEGGVLRWGRESSPTLAKLRQQIRDHYGRPPRVLDPFSGGGAIPLEAMRLGCETYASDLNPVAWFILKCTLEYPQALAGKKHPLPSFAWDDPSFRAEWNAANPIKATSDAKPARGRPKKKAEPSDQFALPGTAPTPEPVPPPPDADLSWHIRAWGRWVHQQARAELLPFYPSYLEERIPDRALYQHHLDPTNTPRRDPEPQDLCAPTDASPEIVPTDADPQALLNAKNKGIVNLHNPAKPRWVHVPTIAYLWARTIPCKNCGFTIPLLKTKSLSKKTRAFLRLDTQPDPNNPSGHAPLITVHPHEPEHTDPKRRKAHNAQLGAGTISRKGTRCPHCHTPMTTEDIRLRAKQGHLGYLMTAVVVQGPSGKEFRAPRPEELAAAQRAQETYLQAFDDIPLGLPTEPTPKAGMGASRAFSVDGYGIDQWHKLFCHRQLLALSVWLKSVRALMGPLASFYKGNLWVEAIYALMCIKFDRLLDRCSTLCRPDPSLTQSGIINTFSRFALPMTWDFIEGNTLKQGSGGWLGSEDWIALVSRHLDESFKFKNDSEEWKELSLIQIDKKSSIHLDHLKPSSLDAVVTDPPYYDAIPYSDLMDFFYVWLRRLLWKSPVDTKGYFEEKLSPKWDHGNNDGELIEDGNRFRGEKKAKEAYEDGMSRAFQAMHRLLCSEGRLVVVFANKQPDAWETLVSALIRAGFQITGSWPITTEMQTRTRSIGSAALASSVWLVCRKRAPGTRPGFDNVVLEEMETNIQAQLKRFWDAGIRGPDLVWSATGPALEAYSRYPMVKKFNEAGQMMSVPEFLAHARRLVVEYVVGSVLKGEGGGLDPVTTYWILHRQSYGMDKVPAGACILFAISCGLSDRLLLDTWDILKPAGKASSAELEEGDEPDDESDDGDEGGSSGSKVCLKGWEERTRKQLGEPLPNGEPAPWIDRVHRCLHLWDKGDEQALDDYITRNSLRTEARFHRVLQAAIELAPAGSPERRSLEALSGRVGLGTGGNLLV